MKPLITTDELLRLMPNLRRSQAEVFAPYLEAAMLEHDITTKRRRCAFLAQLAHESEQLNRWQENLNYKADRLLVIFPNHFKSQAEAASYAHRPVAIANHVYANRMGNGDEASGDGYNYRGRGPIGLTGRVNYKIFGADLNLPLEQDPDLAAHTEHGFRIAALFWKRAGCNRIADQLQMNGGNGDRLLLTKITERINGGRNGLSERLNYFRVARQVLHDDDPAQATPLISAAPAESPAPTQASETTKPAEPDVDLLDAAVTSDHAKVAGKTIALRLGKHSLAALTGWEALSRAQQIGRIAVAVVVLGVVGWLVYHNRTRLKSWALVLIKNG